MTNSDRSGPLTTCVRAIFHVLPVLGPGLSPDHGPAAGQAGLTGQEGLVAAKRFRCHCEFTLKINTLAGTVNPPGARGADIRPDCP
jgi:hypothetical protein